MDCLNECLLASCTCHAFILSRCLCIMPVTVLFGIQIHIRWQYCKAEGYFFHWGQQHELLVLSPLSVYSGSALHGHSWRWDWLISGSSKSCSSAACCWRRSMSWQHTAHLSLAVCLPALCCWDPSCLWQCLWRLQPQYFEPLALFFNFASVIIEDKQIIFNPEYIVIPYTLLRKAFLLTMVRRGFPSFETRGGNI